VRRWRRGRKWLQTVLNGSRKRWACSDDLKWALVVCVVAAVLLLVPIGLASVGFGAILGVIGGQGTPSVPGNTGQLPVTGTMPTTGLQPLPMGVRPIQFGRPRGARTARRLGRPRPARPVRTIQLLYGSELGDMAQCRPLGGCPELVARRLRPATRQPRRCDRAGRAR
jgi:hypothetical protein